MTDIYNTVVREGKVPEDWSSWMFSIYKRKGNAMDFIVLSLSFIAGTIHDIIWLA